MDKVVLVMTNDEMLALAGSQMKLWQSGLDLSFTKTDFEKVSDQLKNRVKYDQMQRLTTDELADLVHDYSLLLTDCDYLVNHHYKVAADAVTINNDASAELEAVFHGVQSVDKLGSLKEPEF